MLPIVVIAVLGGVWWRWATIQTSANHIGDGLNERGKGDAAAVELWGSSPNVRDAVVDYLLNRPERLNAAGTDWVLAYTSIESSAASNLAKRLRDRLGKETDHDTRRSLIDAYGSAAARLEPKDAAEAARDLLDRLGKETDPDTRLALIDAAASLSRDPGRRPTRKQLEGLRFALASIAYPLRDAPQSPAWERLEAISGKSFDHKVDSLLDWLKSCCQLMDSDARPSAWVK